MSDTPQAPPATILFVDDENAILSALRRLFRPQGYQILVADSGEEGLRLLEEQPVDLVISDMRMPVMDGAVFLEQVRQRWPDAVRMLLTGYADIASTIAAINRGEIHRYIAKPWDDQDLLLSVREALSRRSLERENLRLLALTQAQNEELRLANETLEERVKARTLELEQVNDMLHAAYQQLEDNYILSMDVFAGLMELRERGSAGYCRQVAKLAQGVSKQLQLPHYDVQDVYVAGLLHEVGRLSLPDAMLQKPVSLMSAEELTRFRRHPLAAEAALMPLHSLKKVSKLVRMQMERIDGKGVPDGISGADFTPAAQALALSIEYHGLINGRLSQRSYKPEEAAQLIAGTAGTHYNRAVVEAFRAYLAETRDEVQSDVCITANDLRPGMVLSRDLLSAKGTLLLAAGFKFDGQVVRQIHEFVQREGSKLKLYVLPFKTETNAGALAAETSP
ncbi:HD domain-containing phosphohydrolase [Roseateles sp. BYS180W]|uniref:HD domain-containing phosphohydrolase n=1 Tax=Roseateles rivi TaxID=3299028 RepID=A0ABW7FT53_9BURK